MYWVADDTNYVLPPMNVNPDTITVSGFSGGAYYANNLVLIESATFAGGGSKCGGPYNRPGKCSPMEPFGSTDNCDATWT
jgi:poly(3-hydroxybutyrate) depolymerase